MELIILGSGASAPSRKAAEVRNPAGYAVRLGSGAVLLDIGFGSVRQLARAGIDPSEVTDVLISHRHPDHIGDLAALLFCLHYDRKPRKGTLRLFGPAGLKAFVESLRQTHSPWLEPKGYRLEVHELQEGQGAAGPDWRAETIESIHNTPALCYRLESAEKVLVYSGDTGVNPKLAEFSKKCDLLLLECTLGDGDKYSWHLNVSQALELASESRARRVLLTHVSTESLASLKPRLKKLAQVSVAEDLQRCKI